MRGSGWFDVRHGTTRAARAPAWLFERLFRRDERNGVRRYRQVGFAFLLGPLGVPLPRRLSPRVVARERVSADGSRISASVRVSAPLVGLLIAYGGCVEV